MVYIPQVVPEPTG